MSDVFVTPKGTARYPHIETPDTAFNQNAYKVDIVLDPEDPETVELMKALDAKVEASLEEAKKKTKGAAKNKLQARPAYESEYDDNGDETGRIIIKCKQNAEIQGEPVDIKVVDAKKNDVQGVRIGAGSTIRVGFSCRSYCFQGMAGITRDLRAVQLLNLVEKEGNFGFDEEEGYTAAPQADDQLDF